MALFKSRTVGDDPPAATQRQPESIEAIRKRAKHRLIGAVVLVLIGVVGFPLIFDTQPRPIAVDIPIEIPDRNKAKPLPVPAQPIAAATRASEPVPAPPVAVASTPAPAVKADVPPVVAKAETPPEAKPEAPATKPEAKAETKPEPKPEAKAKPADDGAKALALLEGKGSSSEAVANGRFVVQVGAFADENLAHQTRLKVEKAGLKTYTNVADTKEGKRIRVRVGPFGTRDEAVKAADKIKGLDLPAAVLTL